MIIFSFFPTSQKQGRQTYKQFAKGSNNLNWHQKKVQFRFSILINIWKMSQRSLLKLVDKYQFNQKNSVTLDGVEQYEATHIETRELITIKRISSKTQKQQSSRILNQLSILKKLNHPSIPKCHKLLKTSNNIYLIFERISGQPLKKILIEQVNSSNCKGKYQQAVKVAQNLGSLLRYLQEVKVCHSSISDVNILIDSSSKIKMANFAYAEELHDSTSLRKFQSKAQESRFAAPQQINDLICEKTDVYRTGMVLREVFLGLKKHIQSSQQKEKQILSRITIILQFLQLATKSELQDRISPEEFNIFFATKKYQKQKSPQKFQLILTDPKFNISKMQSLEEKSQSTHNLQNQVSKVFKLKSMNSTQMGSQTHQYLYIARKVINRRNFSELLLEISNFCLTSKQVSYSRRIPISFLLLKKCTLTVSQLAKFLETGRGGGLKMNEKVKQKLAKHRLFHNMEAIVHKQMNQLREKFLKNAEAVKELQKIETNLNLHKQLQKQQISEDYLRTLVVSFLDEFISWHSQDDSKGQILRISQTINKKHLSLLFILTLIGEYQNLQKIYDTFFSDNGCELWKQSFLVQLNQKSPQDLQSLIIAQSRLKIQKELQNSILGSDSPSKSSHFSSYQKL